MDERTERRKRFIINILYWAAIVAILYGILFHVISWLLPLLIGVLFARLLNPLIKLVARKTRIPRKPVAFVFVFLFIGIIGTLVTLGGIKLFHVVQVQVGQFGEYYEDSVVPALQEIERWITNNLSIFFPDWSAGGDGSDLITWLTGKIGEMVAAINYVGWAASTPAFLIRTLFTFLFTLFATVYFEDAKRFLLKQMPTKKRFFLSDIIISLKRSIISYYGAYLKIMAVTFVELLVGLSIIRGSFSILPAFAVALVDFLPVFGCGTILIPWAVISLITGNITMGIGLLIVYVIVFVIRQFIEPKIVGDQLGLNPLLTLTAMYVGYLAIGFLGLIIMPIVVTVIVDLQNHQKIHVVKTDAEADGKTD